MAFYDSEIGNLPEGVVKYRKQSPDVIHQKV